MGVLEFISNRRFHRSFILPPFPDTGRDKPHRFSFADFGDPNSNAVVFFCGALMGTRFCYAPLDQLANAYNVRIIHVDRPGNGGSDPVEPEKRVQTFLGQYCSVLTGAFIAYTHRNGSSSFGASRHSPRFACQSQWRRYFPAQHHVDISTSPSSRTPLCLLLCTMGPPDPFKDDTNASNCNATGAHDWPVCLSREVRQR